MRSERKEFIKKLSLIGVGMFLFPRLGFTNSNKKEMKDSAIKNIKPLGFPWETRDPFLFCVHHEDFYPKGNDQMGPVTGIEGRNIGNDFTVKDGYRMYHGSKVPGFPGHPHRGFETITVVKKGMVDHSDSLGGAGRYGNGDVQWLTSGKGVQHAEMFPLISKEEENPMELFQIWINLEKKNKMVAPHYKMLWSEEIPKTKYIDENGNATKVNIVAGNLNGEKAVGPPPNSWANNPDNLVAVWTIEMDPNGKWTLPKIEAGINRTVYLYKGDALELNEVELKSYHSAEVLSEEDIHIKASETGAKLLILQGRPIGEPVVQHGPFVMNTEEEIQTAFSEFRQTQFGGWPWEKYDLVHDRNKGRFAIYVDGSEEVRG
jgi:redox-sensitive bicupin YhaK (pirin superfamily)